RRALAREDTSSAVDGGGVIPAPRKAISALRRRSSVPDSDGTRSSWFGEAMRAEGIVSDSSNANRLFSGLSLIRSYGKDVLVQAILPHPTICLRYNLTSGRLRIAVEEFLPLLVPSDIMSRLMNALW